MSDREETLGTGFRMDGGGRRSLSNALHQNVIHFPQSLLGVDALGAGQPDPMPNPFADLL